MNAQTDIETDPDLERMEARIDFAEQILTQLRRDYENMRQSKIMSRDMHEDPRSVYGPGNGPVDACRHDGTETI